MICFRLKVETIIIPFRLIPIFLCFNLVQSPIIMNHQIYSDPDFIKLQFSYLWIDVGIITVENFSKIKQKYFEGEDKNTGHCRWGAFNGSSGFEGINV